MIARPSSFVPCAGCARHVRADEAACPFCGASCVSQPRPASAPSLGLSRAMLIAAAGALSLGGCDDVFISTAHADTHEAVSMVPQYGAPPDFDPTPRPPAAPYDAGAPAQPDAGAHPTRPRS